MGKGSRIRQMTRRLAATVTAGAALGTALVAVSASPVLGDTGCPTAVAPTLVGGFYEIDTPAKLQWLRESAAVSGAMADSYKVTANVNMTGCTWTVGIATTGTPFSGVFDGNSRTISNLTINNTFGNTGIALIRYLTGTLKDLTLSSPSVTGTSNHVAAFVGEVRNGATVTNLTATGVSISGGQQTGGAFGRTVDGSTVQGVSVSGTVAAPSGVGGGIVGSAEGPMSGLTSTATVTGDYNLGGLAGSISSAGSITNSSSSGNVTGSSSIGGAAGTMNGTNPVCGTVTGVTTSGQISGSSQVGGIVGYVNCYSIVRSSSSATVTATGNQAGGLLGYENVGGSIAGSYFTGQVQAAEQVGGIAGATRSPVTDSYSSGTVTATASTNGGRAGGLVGWMLSGASLTRTYATGSVTAPSSGSPSVGGLVGNYTGGTITSSIWDTQSTGRTTSAGTGAKGYTTQQMRSYVLYDADNLNWPITDGISSGNGINTGTTWSVCSGVASGYPFLTRQGLSGTCRPTIAYAGNGNTGGTAPVDSSTPYPSGDTVTVLGNTGNLTKTSSSFVGWNTKADGTGTSYSSGATFTISSPVMFFAVWSAAPQITYGANGGTGSVANTTGSSGSTVVLSNGNGFSRSGFVLSRWDTLPGGNGVSYAKGESVTMPAGGLSLHAVWTATATTTTAPAATTTVVTSTTAAGPTTTVPSAGASTSTSIAQSTAGTTAPAQPGSTATTVAGQSSSTTTVARGGDGGQAGVPSVTTGPAVTTSSTSTSTSTSAPVADGDAPDVENVGPGRTGATVNGQPAVVTAEVEDGSLAISVAGVRVLYSVTSRNGTKKAISSGAVMALSAGDRVRAVFSGFADTTEVSAWVTPDGLLLGTASLVEGTGSVEGTLPEAATPGERRLVTSGKSPGGDPIVIAYGVTVAGEDSPGPSWSVLLIVIVGLAIAAGLLVPAARRRRNDE